MAKIQVEHLARPPLVYSQPYQASLVHTLQLALQRVDYSRESDAISRIGMDWIGL
jgi:hypothetical protein